MSWLQVVAATLIAAAVLVGCLVEFARYRLKGARSRNASYLLAAGGLFSLFLALLSTAPLRVALAALAAPGARLGCFLAGCLLLLASLLLFLYLTYLRPHRLRFEDELMAQLPRPLPGERP